MSEDQTSLETKLNALIEKIKNPTINPTRQEQTTRIIIKTREVEVIIEVYTTTEEINIEEIVVEDMEIIIEEIIAGDITIEEIIVDRIQVILIVITTATIITTTIASDKMHQMMKQQ